MAVISRSDIEKRVRSFDYFHYPLDLGEGVLINPDAASKLKLRNFIWPAVLELCGGSLAGMRVLDLGCNAGFWSFAAHDSGADYVLGIDARPIHIEQAEFVREALNVGHERVAFRRMDIYDVEPAQIGEYDLVLALRILHHLRSPLLALENLRAVCLGYLVVDTKLFTADQRPVLRMYAENAAGVLHGTEGLALLPTRAALKLMLACTGFSDVRRVPPNEYASGSYRSGSRAVFTARAEATEPSRTNVDAAAAV